MKIEAMYSFNQGQTVIEVQFPTELAEIIAALADVDAASAKTKQSQEVTMPGRMLYSPVALNRAILTDRLYQQGWTKPRVPYETTIPETGEAYKGYIEGDGLKNGLGLEVQFGKYAFLGWDVFGKMPIFARLKVFTAGVEVTPMTETSLLGDGRLTDDAWVGEDVGGVVAGAGKLGDHRALIPRLEPVTCVGRNRILFARM